MTRGFQNRVFLLRVEHGPEQTVNLRRLGGRLSEGVGSGPVADVETDRGEAPRRRTGEQQKLVNQSHGGALPVGAGNAHDVQFP